MPFRAFGDSNRHRRGAGQGCPLREVLMPFRAFGDSNQVAGAHCHERRRRGLNALPGIRGFQLSRVPMGVLMTGPAGS